jgi:alanyl-tRNA synthetase
MQSTRVTFPDGSLTGEGDVLIVDRERAVVVVDATPFHPVDHTWPDQPGDSGTITVSDLVLDVSEAVMAAVSDEGELAVGTDIPVKRGADGWTWLVGHRVDGEIPASVVTGASARLEVDTERRAGLSRGHTACHLASLALDAALADLWRKEIGVDPLGHPDFEGRANQTSFIHPDGSVDEYRLGKSLRKAGFDSEGFAASLAQREQRINELLAGWIASGGESRIDVEGPGISDRRTWRCVLPEGEVGFLCGGTHVHSLAEFASISVTLDLSDPQLLVMTTTAVPA